MERSVSPLDRSVLGGLSAFRVAAWAWMAIALYVSRAELTNAPAAMALCVTVLGMTALLAVGARLRPAALLRWPVALAELTLAFTLLVADGWVYGGPHRVSLGSAWPIAATLIVGVVGGPAAGIAAGVTLGLGRFGGTLLDDMASPGLLSLLSTTFLYALAGGAGGLVMRRLRQASDAIAAAKAREEVARTLHDGVLQTLAVVQRRSSDPELAELARTQERELREFLFGIDRAPGNLLTELRHVAAQAEARHGLGVTVTAVDEPGALTGPTVQALAGAVREALTNAAKHGEAQRVVVFVDPGDDEVIVSVNDDGAGFDVDSVTEGVGLSRSIRGRVAEAGGTVELSSTPGHGTEVVMTVPTA